MVGEARGKVPGPEGRRWDHPARPSSWGVTAKEPVAGSPSEKVHMQFLEMGGPLFGTNELI